MRRRRQDEVQIRSCEVVALAEQRLAKLPGEGVGEADADKRRDLLQEIHVALWRSFDGYEAKCSLRTWVYRVAHNVAASYVTRQRRIALTFVSLEQLEPACDGGAADEAAIRRDALQRILALIYRLKPLDRQVMLSYLKGMDAASIGEITGISAGNARSTN